MDLNVTGRHIHVPDDFRAHVDERVEKLQQLIGAERRLDVVVAKGHEGDDGVVVELTLHAKGPIIRAEAAHADKFVAFDHAFDKLVARVKKAMERRRTGRRRAVVPAPAALPVEATPVRAPAEDTAGQTPAQPAEQTQDDGPDVVDLPDTPIEVRVKHHQADPMTLEEAVYEMEMVGHDFFLFIDAESGTPSVLYKRRGWSYGVLHLEPRTQPQAVSA